MSEALFVLKQEIERGTKTRYVQLNNRCTLDIDEALAFTTRAAAYEYLDLFGDEPIFAIANPPWRVQII